MEKWLKIMCGATLLTAVAACSGADATTADTTDTTKPDQVLLLGKFSADSAYSYIEHQVDFGPRVPGTEAHEECAAYIIDELNRHGVDTMYVQQGTVEAFNGDVLPITNIIAGFNPKALRRILLVAHWDTRPWADNESTIERRKQPIAGANDGGSGVGVLLEIARNLGAKHPKVGVDLLFVDAEDYGDSSGFSGRENTWCLGTQYWLEHMVPYRAENLPVYGILLDMVGGKNARFHYEHFSKTKVPTATLKVWSEAQRLNHGDYFIPKMGGAITDDHVFLTNAGIPTVDIVETLNEQTNSFPPTWHTLDDNMRNISKSTLQAVGETVLNVIYKEKAY